MTNYFLYARKSTESEEKQTLSIEAQTVECSQFAEKEGLSVVYEYAESQTAKAPGRTVFNEMIQSIENGNAEGIIAWHPDRLARNSVDGGKIIYLIDIGKIKSLKFPTFWFENTPQGKFMLNIAFSQSKYYVDNLSQNIKRGFRQKLRNGGWPSKAPLGYVNDPKTHTVIFDIDRYKYIKKAFELYATGDYSLSDIVRLMNQWGFITAKGKRIHKSVVVHMFTNPFYFGMMKYAGELYKGKHKPIISRYIFDKVQQAFIEHSNTKSKLRKKKDFPFIGFMRCGECGRMITAELQKGHHYYRCTKKNVKCFQRYIREESLIEQIRKNIKEVWITDEITKLMIERLKQSNKKDNQERPTLIKKFEAQLNEEEKKSDRLLDLNISGLITAEKYQSKKEEILKKTLRIEQKLTNLKENPDWWLEPCRNFILRCNYVEKIALEGDPASLRDFCKKSGSNFILKDKVFSFQWQKPYSFVAEGNRKYFSFSRQRNINSISFSPPNNSLVEMAGNSQPEAPAELNLSSCPDWVSLLDEIRTYFIETPSPVF